MNILVVDDEELICWALKRTLESREGYSVSCVYNGRDAIQKISENMYDLVITDLKLPDASGSEILQKIKEVNSSTPVIIISAYFSQSSIDEAVKHGVYRCINKPFQIEDILNNVKEAVELRHAIA